RIERGDGHDRDVHRRKHVHGHLYQAGDAHDGDEQADDDDEIRIADSKFRHDNSTNLESGGFGTDFYARLKPGAAAEDDDVALVEAGADLDAARRLDAERDFARFHTIVRRDHEDVAAVFAVAIYGHRRDRQDARVPLKREIHFRIHSRDQDERWI